MRRSSSGVRCMVRRAAFAVFAAGAVLALLGCDPSKQALMTTPEPLPLRLAVPDRDFHLDPVDRSKVLPGFDVDALERLLRMIRPDMRLEILKHFLPRENGERLGILAKMYDPELQKVLEEVWAPMWDEVGATDAQLEMNNYYPFPGREIARQRRMARLRIHQEGFE